MDHERRSVLRVDVTWSVDCEAEDTFLYASITNVSELGIFVRTHAPLELGTPVTLRFAPTPLRAAARAHLRGRLQRDGRIGRGRVREPESTEPFVVHGVVQWVNPLRLLGENRNPGMGVRFVDITPDDRERLVAAIHTIAYLRESLPS